MNTSFRVLLGPLLMLIPAAAAASDAAVSQGIYKMGKSPAIGDRLPVVGPVYKVYSEGGDDYDFVGEKNKNLDFIVTGTAYCTSPRREGRITVDIQGITDYKSKRGKFGHGTVVGDQFRLSVPHGKLTGFNPVKACNDGLRTLAAETGDSKAELIARGFSLRAEDTYEVTAAASCSGGVARGHYRTDRAPLDVWVDCRPNPDAVKKEPKSAPKPAQPAKPAIPTRQVQVPARQVAKPARVSAAPARLLPMVTAVDFRVEPASSAGSCPVSLQFSGSITAGRPGTVRYAVVGHDGSRSATRALTFAAAGEQAIAVEDLMVSVPRDVPAVSGTDEDEPTRLVRGWRRLEIVEPAGMRLRQRADYRVMCVESPEDLEEELPQ